MSTELIGYLVGAVGYAVSTALAIKLSDVLFVPIAAALAPTVAISGLGLTNKYGAPMLVAGPILAALLLTILRRSLFEVLSQLALFAASAGIVFGVVRHEGGASLAGVAACLSAAAAFLLGDLARQSLNDGTRNDLRQVARQWWILQGVLVCAGGLTVLVFDRMGWAAFGAMALVLAVTKREFEAFADSRTAYAQTLRALDRLADRGHESRISPSRPWIGAEDSSSHRTH